ncbi:MAG: hypothetical protein VB078_04380 [Clostridiaceae bacterium]|nr:hypothetical protein [Clostridiaceae bacterium]
MKYRTAVFAIAVALAMTFAIYAGGGSEDPLVSLSHFNSILVKPATGYITTAVEGLSTRVLAALDSKLEKGGSTLSEQQKDEMAQKAASMASGSGMVTLTLSKGQRVTGPVGGGFILESGEGTVNSFTGNDVINISLGSAAAPGTAVGKGCYYMVGIQNGCGMTVTSEQAEVTLVDGAYSEEGYSSVYQDKAETLCNMGLFRGTDIGFELERAPTRQEALIMLVRLLGEEPQALSFSGSSAFKDLTGWEDGKKYIAYGENRGYTNGISADTFNQYGSADRHVYITYVLRALGYSDKDGDFVWNTTSDQLAVKVGLVTQAQLEAMEKSGFYRDHVALISYNAIKAYLKDGSMTLGNRLAAGGHISWESYNGIK